MLVPSSPLCQKWVTVLLSPVCDGVCVCVRVCVCQYCMCMWIHYTLLMMQRGRHCVLCIMSTFNLCVCVCVCVCAHAHSHCGMCSHSQTNNGSLPATMVRERIGLRGSAQGQPFVCCAPLWSLWSLHSCAHIWLWHFWGYLLFVFYFCFWNKW